MLTAPVRPQRSRPRYVLSSRVAARLSERLVNDGRLSTRDLSAATARVQQTSESLTDALVALGLLSERAAYEALAAAADLRFLDMHDLAPSPLAVQVVPERVARQHRIVPIAIDGRSLTYATAQPLDADAERDVEFTSARRAVAVVGCRTELEALLDRAYPKQAEVERLLSRLGPGVAIEGIETILTDAPSESAIIDLCNHLLARAVESGASDIHIEFWETEAVVRYRIAGILEPVMTLPGTACLPVRNRFKIMARADISVRHRPQDGAFAVRMDGRRIDVRLSSMPTVTGEKLVLRVIDSRAEIQDLSILGYQDGLQDRLRRALARPDGLVLVTGPTGSGKTTTLYAALSQLRTGRVNIVSVEDPVERTLPGITQVPVNVRGGNTFAAVLKSVLRQEPNVIMVGEIRDAEVAGIVGQAAYTGHLVLSSLHTMDAASAVTRLLNLGLEAFKIAESLTAIVAQRLVRRLCPECRIVHSDDKAKQLGIEHGTDRVGASAGPGCQKCRFTGYVDRIPVAELLTPTDEIRAAILNGATAAELRNAMRLSGMPTMRQSALVIVAQGITSIEEADRVLAADDKPPDPELRPNRILIADDEPITRMLVKVLLEREGYGVMEAHTGVQAVEIASHQQPDLIVMDLNMPQMDGYDAIRQIRKMPVLANVPVMVLTAEDGPGVEACVIDLGADDYLVKPFDPAVLTNRVQAVFRRRTA